MAKAISEVKVFIPGANRDWDEVKGLATITDDGEIHIKLLTQGAAEWLVEAVKAQAIMQCSFDYAMTPELIESINKKYRK